MAKNGAALAIVVMLVLALFAVFYVRESAVNSNVPFSCPVNEFLHELNPGACSQVRYDQLAQTPFNASKGLVGYWPMNEAQGTITYDYSGNQLTGTLQNSPTWITGRFGSALNFTASSSQYVAMTQPYNFNSSFTISGWIKVNGVIGNTYGIVAEGPASSAGNFAIYTQSSTGDLSLLIGTGSAIYAVHATDVLTNASTFFAFTWNGTLITAYIDGNYISSTTFTGTPTISTYDLWIGHVGANYMNGMIDDLRMYNYSMSASQITQLYNYVPAV